MKTKNEQYKKINEEDVENESDQVYKLKGWETIYICL
jgi:hypothetical protein